MAEDVDMLKNNCTIFYMVPITDANAVKSFQNVLLMFKSMVKIFLIHV